MVLFLIPFCISSNWNFCHILIQIFLQLVAGLDREVIFWVSYFNFGQCWGYGQVTFADFLPTWQGFLGG